jgi:uncharacterized 2Fe-2S/4Fe-4S cluster protein (DUF4445 family)
MTQMHTVVLLPSGRRGEVAAGTSLRTASRAMGVDIESICAENATCGKCKVLVEERGFERYGVLSSRENLSPMAAEEIDYFAHRPKLLAAHGWEIGQVRLACQAKIQGDLLITIPEESRGNKQLVRKSAGERHIDIKPSIRKVLVEMNPPTLSNTKADWERLASGIVASIGLIRNGEQGLPHAKDLTIDYSCLKTLSDTLRDSNWRVTVSIRQDREVIRVEPGYTEYLYGAALDIGSTTVALYLCNLENGEIVASESEMNPQITYGEDVMSRIQYSMSNSDGLAILHKAIINTINQMVINAARSAGITTEDILELTVVGNTTMHHLFLNLSPRHLGAAPFASTLHHSIDIKARELDLKINRSAYVHVLPTIASFIGADTTGVLLAEEPHKQAEYWLIIDIGTNAELVLGNKDKLICASTPTGPALEGAHIQYGMRAAPGAIECIEINDKTLEPRWRIIGQKEWNTGKAKGICGSAVIDAVAELFRVGVVNSRGRFSPGMEAPRLRRGENGMEYVIAYASETSIGQDIPLTQQDVRQIQLAKAALFVAARTLLNQMGLQTPDKILLAGAFGTYINKANAMLIGMIPDCPLENVFSVGNSAGDGARIALLNVEKRQEALEIAAHITRIELPTDPNFQDQFIRALNFPHLDESFPHIAYLIPDHSSHSTSDPFQESRNE